MRLLRDLALRHSRGKMESTQPTHKEGDVSLSLSRKRKKELRKLQNTATQLWESQQGLLNDASGIAREAGRQLGNYGRETVVPTVQHGIDTYVAPKVDRGIRVSRSIIDDRIVPAVGGVVGSALSVMDAANNTRTQLAARRFGLTAAPAPVAKRGMGAGGVIAIILGVSAAAAVLYAAWQTLRADDELWVADDPLRAPEA